MRVYGKDICLKKEIKETELVAQTARSLKENWDKASFLKNQRSSRDLSNLVHLAIVSAAWVLVSPSPPSGGGGEH